MHPKKLHLALLLVFCFTSASAQAAKEEQLLLAVPDLTAQAAPSADFLAIIHSAVHYLDQSGSPLKTNIVSNEPLAGEYAKIILHSYGLKNAQIDILQNISSLKSDDLEDLEVFGNVPLNDQTFLNRQGIVLHDQPLAKNPTLYFDPDSSANATDLGIIALGTGPLDKTTPSLDMVKRVEKAIQLFEENPGAVCIFTGGKTAGPISEARMMFLIADARGLPADKVLLEEGSNTTLENAKFTAQLVHDLPLKRFLLVTRPPHMKRALSNFKSHPEFRQIQPEPTDITEDEIVKNISEYLEFNPSDRAKYILNKIRQEYHDN